MKTKTKLRFRTGQIRESFFESMNPIYVELNETVDRIAVTFKFHPQDVAKIKSVKGRRYDPDTRVWTVPMDMMTARELRVLYEERMILGPAMTAWARAKRQEERNLRSLHKASDANLTHTPQLIRDVIAGKPMKFALPAKHPLLSKRDPRPYQRADIKMMSLANAINGNDVGTGKTLECIGALYEAQIAPKPVLVVAPRRSLINVWQTEFERLSDYEVLTSESPTERKAAIEEFLSYDHQNFLVLALIADDIRLEKYYDVSGPAPSKQDKFHAGKDYQGNWYKYRSRQQRDLFQTEFGAFIIDEFHNTGLNSRRSLFFNSAQLIKAERRWPMSGTPIGGKARRLWPVLNFLDRKQFSAEWTWIDRWLVVEEEVFYKKGDRRGMPTGKSRKVGGIKPEMEEEFYKHHSQFMTRRTKRDALPGLPAAVGIIVDTPMSGRQLRDYQDFEDDHEIMLGEKRLSGSIVLSQYTRLRQMASAKLDWDRFYTKPIATGTSNKIDHLLERLDENGIRKLDYEPGARAYVGCLEIGMVDAIIGQLRRHGIECGALTGKTKHSKPLIDYFNGTDEKPYVLVMTIQTGGTALNLESANSAHAIDDAWDPDVMHQFFGRGDRGSRTTALKCYTYRTPNSIQEYIAQVAGDKKITNRNVLGYVKEIEKLRKGR